MATLASLPAGAKVKFGSYYGEPIVWRVGDQNHYGTGLTPLVTDRVIKYAAFDATESGGDSNRMNNGNNRWLYSNARQWLNSDAAAGSWYSAQHQYDRPPSSSYVWSGYNAYDQDVGFLNGFTADEKDAIQAVTIENELASYDGGGKESTTEKVFLLSCTEVGLSGGQACGKLWSIFNSGNSSRVCYGTAKAVAASTYSAGYISTTSGNYWFLRDAYASNSCSVRLVYADGSLSNDYARNGDNGLRPALNLKSEISVSDSTDGDGCYTLSYNNPPEAPASLSVPATSKWDDKSIALSWPAGTDPDGDALTYVVQRQQDAGEWTQVYSGAAMSYTDKTVAKGTSKVTYRVASVDTHSAQSGWRVGGTCQLTYNKAPNAPASISVPDAVVSKEAVDVSWPAGTDPDGDALTYELQRSVDGAGWTGVYGGPALSYADSTIPYGSSTVAYRVRSVDPYTAASAWTESVVRSVTNADYAMTVANFIAFLKNGLGDGLTWDGTKLDVTK